MLNLSLTREIVRFIYVYYKLKLGNGLCKFIHNISNRFVESYRNIRLLIRYATFYNFILKRLIGRKYRCKRPCRHNAVHLFDAVHCLKLPYRELNSLLPFDYLVPIHHSQVHRFLLIYKLLCYCMIYEEG